MLHEQGIISSSEFMARKAGLLDRKEEWVETHFVTRSPAGMESRHIETPGPAAAWSTERTEAAYSLDVDRYSTSPDFQPAEPLIACGGTAAPTPASRPASVASPKPHLPERYGAVNAHCGYAATSQVNYSPGTPRRQKPVSPRPQRQEPEATRPNRSPRQDTTAAAEARPARGVYTSAAKHSSQSMMEVEPSADWHPWRETPKRSPSPSMAREAREARERASPPSRRAATPPLAPRAATPPPPMTRAAMPPPQMTRAATPPPATPSYSWSTTSSPSSPSARLRPKAEALQSTAHAAHSTAHEDSGMRGSTTSGLSRVSARTHSAGGDSTYLPQGGVVALPLLRLRTAAIRSSLHH